MYIRDPLHTVYSGCFKLDTIENNAVDDRLGLENEYKHTHTSVHTQEANWLATDRYETFRDT